MLRLAEAVPPCVVLLSYLLIRRSTYTLHPPPPPLTLVRALPNLLQHRAPQLCRVRPPPRLRCRHLLRLPRPNLRAPQEGRALQLRAAAEDLHVISK